MGTLRLGLIGLILLLIIIIANSVYIVTDKQKSVKEKNSSNEITKYEIKLNVKI